MCHTRHLGQQMPKFLESATSLEVKDVIASEIFYREKLGLSFSTRRAHRHARRRSISIGHCTSTSMMPTRLRLNWQHAASSSIAPSKTRITAVATSMCAKLDGHLIGIGQKLAKG
jgi:hypothetical protein